LKFIGDEPDCIESHFKNLKRTLMANRLVSIRKHGSNTSSSDLLFRYPHMLNILASLYHEGHVSRQSFVRLTSKIYYKMGLLLVRDSQPKTAAQYFLRYCRLRPLHWKGWGKIGRAHV